MTPDTAVTALRRTSNDTEVWVRLTAAQGPASARVLLKGATHFAPPGVT